jgi:hypothetical protein
MRWEKIHQRTQRPRLMARHKQRERGTIGEGINPVEEGGRVRVRLGNEKERGGSSTIAESGMLPRIAITLLLAKKRRHHQSFRNYRYPSVSGIPAFEQPAKNRTESLSRKTVRLL